MKKNQLPYALFTLMVVSAILLGACAPAATSAPTTAPTTAEQPTTPPVATEVPTEAATVAATTAATSAATQAATAAVKPTVPPAACAPLANKPTVNAGDLGSTDKPIVMAFVPSGD